MYSWDNMAFKNIKLLKSSNLRFKVQNDLRDWEIDGSNKPIKVRNEKYWNMKGISVDPQFIPKEKISLEKITIVKDKDNKDVQQIEIIDLETAIKTAVDAEIDKKNKGVTP